MQLLHDFKPVHSEKMTFLMVRVVNLRLVLVLCHENNIWHWLFSCKHVAFYYFAADFNTILDLPAQLSCFAAVMM